MTLKPWLNKKTPTSPQKKEQHIVRKLKKQREQDHLTQEWDDQIKDYKNKNNKVY